MKKSILILFVLYLSLISVELFAQTVDHQIILTEINKIRKTGCKCGNKYYPAVNPLVWSDTLELVSQEHSNYMVKEKIIGHAGRGGTSAGKRLREKGYDFYACADNLASGQENELEVMSCWIHSPVHCENMMNKDVAEVAVARKKLLWTMILAKRFIKQL
jgi:uncharacterized protein YkwD